ncbi:hypothetical protein [Nocardiopsis alba]
MLGFVNRTGELELLSNHMPGSGQESGGRVEATMHAIVDTTGVGKTALALHWAHHVCGHFPDGQLYVNVLSLLPHEA